MNIPITFQIKQENLDGFFADIELFTKKSEGAQKDLVAIKNFVDSFPQRISAEANKDGTVIIKIKPCDQKALDRDLEKK